VQSGEGKTVVRPLRDFIAGLSNDTGARTRFRAYGTLGGALIRLATLKVQPLRSMKRLAPNRYADGLAMRARASFTRHQVDRAYVEAQHALAVDKSHRVAAASSSIRRRRLYRQPN